ncbi:adenylate/guanylate cyclase domain-containing protein [Verrucomicrobiales bacterium BCK34]|nr:adenylate/guanylate cyclase domain-containing protein [Verrucomicrobiales bacterium BCK34]
MKAILKNIVTEREFDLGAVSMIGRSSECQIQIPDPRVSRRHAMIRKQDGGYYLFDLGSFNGSYLNGSRVTTARQLNDGSTLSFAGHEYSYRQEGSSGATQNLNTLGGSTIAMIRSTPVIILVSDIMGFTALSEAISPDDLAQIMGGWYADCEMIISSAGATVDKFIGDCVLAYWTTVDENTLKAALSAAEQLLASSDRIQKAHPEVFAEVSRDFKIGVALHTGKVAYGGMSQGEFTLVGDPVNLTFRLESLTRKLDRPVLASGDFMRALPNSRAYGRGMGVHKVKGRAQGVEVHSITQFPNS